MSVNGPLARTLEDVIYYSKVVVDSQPWLHDTKCHPIPWRAVDVPKKLKIGVMWNDGLVQPTPPIARALRETVDKLKAAGHEIIDWDPIDIKQGENIIVNFFVADGGESIGRELDKTGEPWRPEMLQFRDAKALSMYELWQLQAERTDFQNRNIDRWNETGIDALLQPTMAYVTIEHGKARHSKWTLKTYDGIARR
jgi:amidase